MKEKTFPNQCQLVRIIIFACLLCFISYSWRLLAELCNYCIRLFCFATSKLSKHVHPSLKIIEHQVLGLEKKGKKGSAEGFSNFKDGAGMHVALKQISLVISKGVDFPLIDFFAQRIIRVTRMIHIRNNLITAATFNAFAANLRLREAPVFLLL